MTSAECSSIPLAGSTQVVDRVVDGLTPEQLAFWVDPEANSIAWLVWHLTRIQDNHRADATHVTGELLEFLDAVAGEAELVAPVSCGRQR